MPLDFHRRAALLEQREIHRWFGIFEIENSCAFQTGFVGSPLILRMYCPWPTLFKGRPSPNGSLTCESDSFASVIFIFK